MVGWIDGWAYIYIYICVCRFSDSDGIFGTSDCPGEAEESGREDHIWDLPGVRFGLKAQRGLHPMFATGNKPKSRELLRRAMMQLCWACFVTNLLYIERRI